MKIPKRMILLLVVLFGFGELIDRVDEDVVVDRTGGADRKVLCIFGL